MTRPPFLYHAGVCDVPDCVADPAVLVVVVLDPDYGLVGASFACSDKAHVRQRVDHIARRLTAAEAERAVWVKLPVLAGHIYDPLLLMLGAARRILRGESFKVL